MKSIWKGYISFGLVNIPIEAYPIVTPKLISFREMHKECGSPLEHKRWCPKCNREVKWDEVSKGFEIEKGKYVMLSKEDLEAAKLRTVKNIEILYFVDKSEIDPIYLKKPYFIVPSQGGEKAYSLFKQALQHTNKSAIAKAIIRDKEYYVLIYPYKTGILMYLLYYPYEIKDINNFSVPSEKISKEELKLAILLIEKLSSNFDVSKFKNEYLENLKQIIKSKLSGKSIAVQKEKVKKSKELLEALKESVKNVAKSKN